MPRAFAETTILLALGGETASLAVLVDGIADPVDTSVAADSLVRGATRSFGPEIDRTIASDLGYIDGLSVQMFGVEEVNMRKDENDTTTSALGWLHELMFDKSTHSTRMTS